MSRPSRLVEGVDEIRTVNRHAERHVAQPDRASNVELLVAKENAKRRLRMIRRDEQHDDGADAKHDRCDKKRIHPPLFVRVQSGGGVPPECPHRETETNGQRRQREGYADHDADNGRGDPALHATSSENHVSYCPAMAGSANRADASFAAAAMFCRRRSSVRIASSAFATAAGVCSGTITPSTLSRMTSSGPGELVTTTGTPHAIASISTLPNPS